MSQHDEMARTASWDIVTGVGLTALGVAAGRAVETSRDDRLVTDPYAAAFVQAAGASMEMPTRVGEGGEAATLWELVATYMGIRSRFFDDFFADASGAGVRQAVLLAAGLDTRAYRLEWATGTVVFEIDAPKVLEFKDTVLADQRAQPRCSRRMVAADLREDWPAALHQAGFDPAVPTAWLAEGLLPFLPDEAKASLFARVHALSAPGSRIAVEHFDGDTRTWMTSPMFQDMAQRFGFDITALWPAEQHFDPTDWLTRHGWAVSPQQAAELGKRYGRPLDATVQSAMGSSLLLTAHSR